MTFATFILRGSPANTAGDVGPVAAAPAAPMLPLEAAPALQIATEAERTNDAIMRNLNGAAVEPAPPNV